MGKNSLCISCYYQQFVLLLCPFSFTLLHLGSSFLPINLPNHWSVNALITSPPGAPRSSPGWSTGWLRPCPPPPSCPSSTRASWALVEIWKHDCVNPAPSQPYCYLLRERLLKFPQDLKVDLMKVIPACCKSPPPFTEICHKFSSFSLLLASQFEGRTKFDSDCRRWSRMQAGWQEMRVVGLGRRVWGPYWEPWPSGGRTIRPSYWLSCHQSQTIPWPGKIEKSQMHILFNCSHGGKTQFGSPRKQKLHLTSSWRISSSMLFCSISQLKKLSSHRWFCSRKFKSSHWDTFIEPLWFLLGDREGHSSTNYAEEGAVGKADRSGWEDDDILLLVQGWKFTSFFLAQVPKTTACHHGMWWLIT